MNTHKLEFTAKGRHLCILLLLCMQLAWGGVPGPCRHSVTKDHLLSLNHLIDNQLDNGCSMIYVFTERQSLSKVCYIKAVFPQIMELLNTHFHYAKKSDNRRYVNTLKKVIYNLYSQRCIPEINEEIEDSPVRFMRVRSSSPKEALKKAKAVIQMYMTLMTESAGPVDWNCQEEYAVEEDTELHTISTGSPNCRCSCLPAVQTTAQTYPTINTWSSSEKPTNPLHPSRTHQSLGIRHYNTKEPLGTSKIRGFTTAPSRSNDDIGRHPSKERDLSDNTATAYDNVYFPIPHPNTVNPGSYVIDETREAFTFSSLASGTKDSLKEHFSVSKVAPITPAPYLYNIVDPIPSRKEHTAFALAKRSLDAKNFYIPRNSETGHHQDRVARPAPEETQTRVNILQSNMDTTGVQVFKLTQGTQEGDLQTQRAEPETNIRGVHRDMFSTDMLSNKETKGGPKASSHNGPLGKSQDGNNSLPISSQSMLIVITVSGGMLFVFVWSCLLSKRLIKRPVHQFSVIEIQRLGPTLDHHPSGSLYSR